MAETDRTDQTPGSDAVEFSSEQIATFLAESRLSHGALEGLADALGLDATERAVLGGGRALRVTGAQFAAMKAALAEHYARRPPGQEVVDADGGGCGCSGPPPQPKAVPAVTTTGSNIDVTSAGTAIHTGKLDGATITLRKGVEYKWKAGGDPRTGAFSIHYEGGADAQNAHWLQFIWREVIPIDAKGKANPLTDSITTTGGTYNLTAGGTETTYGSPGQSNFNTDTADASDPFYEAKGPFSRTADSTSIYDRPTSADAYLRREFDNGAKKVISRAHFRTFLVMKDKVSYRVVLTNEWVANSKADSPAVKTTAGDCGAASELSPDALRKRFHAQFPKYNYVQ